MIIVTGPGRSGTSSLALLYKELGFDPGGEWNQAIRGGLEAREIQSVNRRILLDLGVPVFGRRRPPELLRKLSFKLTPSRLRQAGRRRFRDLGTRPRPGARVPWERFQGVVKAYRDELRALSTSHTVVKDPNYCWTLPVWAEAGADIDYVLVCVRATDAVARSRITAGHARPGSDVPVRDSVIYSLGLCMATIYDHGFDHGVVRFPHFIRQPNVLFEQMRFPEPVSEERFREAFDRVFREDLVHDWR